MELISSGPNQLSMILGDIIMRVFCDPANPCCAQPQTPHLQGGSLPETDAHTAFDLSLELVEAHRDLDVLSTCTNRKYRR